MSMSSYTPPPRAPRPPKHAPALKPEPQQQSQQEKDHPYVMEFAGKNVMIELRGGSLIRGFITGYFRGFIRFDEAEVRPWQIGEWSTVKKVLVDRGSAILIHEL